MDLAFVHIHTICLLPDKKILHKIALAYAAHDSLFDQGYKTPFYSNFSSFTELLNFEHTQPTIETNPKRKVVLPVLFLGYSGIQSTNSEEDDDNDDAFIRQANISQNIELGIGKRQHN